MKALIAIGTSRGASCAGEALTPLEAVRWLYGVLSMSPSPSWPHDAALCDGIKEPVRVLL
jgi:hypothetical protein